MGLDIHLSYPDRRLDVEDGVAYGYAVDRDAEGDLHPCWSYHGFMEFRMALCRAVGLDDFKRFGAGYPVSWPPAEVEPLMILLSHSDCDGEIGHEDAGRLAARLLMVAPAAFPDDDYDRHMGVLLARFCEQARAEGRLVLFR